MAGTLEVQATWGCRKRRRPDGGRQRRTTTTTTTRDGYDDDGRGRQRRRRSTTTTLTTPTVGEDDDEARGHHHDFYRARRQSSQGVAGLLRRGAPLSGANAGPARGRSALATDRCALAAIARGRSPLAGLFRPGPPFQVPGCARAVARVDADGGLPCVFQQATWDRHHGSSWDLARGGARRAAGSLRLRLPQLLRLMAAAAAAALRS